jgi:hypothetical protein
MFKSSKVIPVMLASVVIAKRRYSIGEYAAAFLLVVGITMFTLADKVCAASRGFGCIHSATLPCSAVGEGVVEVDGETGTARLSHPAVQCDLSV